MADIRIKDLPNEASPSGADFVAIDLVSTRKTTVTLLTEAGRPAASQAEAEAGIQATHAMTPLLTKQAIDFQVGAAFVPLTRDLTAGAGLSGGGDLSVDRSFSVDFGAVQAFSTKLSNIDAATYSAGSLIIATGVNTFDSLPPGSDNQILQIIGGVVGWQNVAGTGDVVGPASSVTGTIATYNGTTGKILLAGNPSMSALQAAERGPLPTIANSGVDAVNDIVFGVGAGFSTDATHWPLVGAAMTKQLDAAWAAGTNAGGRMSAAAIANTTYWCYMIRNPTTGAEDYGFDVSATAPTLPAGFTQYRRLHAILRESGTIIPFTQVGNTIYRTNSSNDFVATTAQSNVLQTLGVPIGVKVQPLVTWSATATTANFSNFLGEGDAATARFAMGLLVASGTATGMAQALAGGLYTNTAGQLRLRVSIVSGTIGTQSLGTCGWIDTRE